MLLGMNKDQWIGLLRYAGGMLLTYLVSSGRLTNEQSTALVSGLTQAAPVLATIGLAVWGVVSKRDAAKLAAVAAMPGVQIQVSSLAPPAAQAAAASTDPALANVTKE